MVPSGSGSLYGRVVVGVVFGQAEPGHGDGVSGTLEGPPWTKLGRLWVQG